MKQSPNDSKQYRAITLPNGLRVLLVHHAKSHKSAAALAVNVGHFDDPIHRQGLAHFLEHMLFLGTKKQPSGGEFQKFISVHGGSNNAWTATEHTCFNFDIYYQHFSSALAQFSDFFTSPLLSDEFINSERKNIDAEFKLKLKDDIRRLYDVHKATVNPQHPFAKFSVGNSETLADNAEHILRNDVRHFFQKHYQAHFMTLVLEGRQSLAELENLAKSNFSTIKSNNIAKAKINQPLYLPEHQKQWINVQSVKNDKQLIISFAMPCIDQFYRDKPESILAYLIGHEGPGSILSLLKSKQWAIALTAGAGINGSNFKDFNINISLTALGKQHLTSIISIVFSYIHLLRTTPINPQYYQEKKALAELSFFYHEKLSPLDSACQLVINMQHYPVQDYIFGDYVMDSLNQMAFDTLLTFMTATNMRLIVISQQADNQANYNISKWYKVPFLVTDICSNKINKWQQSTNINELYLPKKNNYIVSQPALIDKSSELITPLTSPENIYQENGLNIWFKHDISFNTPKGYIYLSIDSPIVTESISNIAMTRLFIDIFRNAVAEEHYDAELAGIHYHLYYHQGGMTLQLSGISTKQEQLFALLLANILNANCPETTFNSHKQRLIKHWKNTAQSKSISQLFAKLSAAMQPTSPDNTALFAALAKVDFTQFKKFIDQLFTKVTLECLIYGNWSKNTAESITNSIKQQFTMRLSSKCRVEINNSTLCKHQPMNIELELPKHDHAAVLYYPMPDKNLDTIALNMLTKELLSPIFFQEMRTEKQYGYLVGVGYIPVNHYPGIAFYIQSPHTDSYTLTSAINNFIVNINQHVANICDEHWQQLTFYLIKQLQEKHINLRIKSQSQWTTIRNTDADFDQRQRLIDTLKSLTITDMMNFITQHFNGLHTDTRLSLLSYENPNQLLAMKKKIKVYNNRT